MSTDTHSLAQWLRDYAGEFCEEREAIMIRAAADEIDKPRIETPTIRQQFVMAAMQGILASAEWYPFDKLAELSCAAADACIAEEARTRK